MKQGQQDAWNMCCLPCLVLASIVILSPFGSSSETSGGDQAYLLRWKQTLLFLSPYRTSGAVRHHLSVFSSLLFSFLVGLILAPCHHYLNLLQSSFLSFCIEKPHTPKLTNKLQTNTFIPSPLIETKRNQIGIFSSSCQVNCRRQFTPVITASIGFSPLPNHSLTTRPRLHLTSKFQHSHQTNRN